jgi:hypothetical protein
MPVTVSYDLRHATSNQRNYVRSMFERFGWRRLGGSVLRYDGRRIANVVQEDWLNDVIPAVMFFRSYVLHHTITVRFFTLDTMSISRIDHSAAAAPFGTAPQTGANVTLRNPTNVQSSEQNIRDFIDAAITAA